MSSYIDLLNTAAQKVNIIVGITFFVLGLVGNSMNILIFSSLLKIQVFPPSPGRLYLLATAIANLVFVGYLLLTRILISGFFIPVTNTINFICKSRFYIGQVCMFTSLFCTSFATIDQYFISNRSVRIRQLSHLSFAKIIILVSVFLWCSINIPVLFLYNVYPRNNGTSTVCTVYSPAWSFYYTYFQSLALLCLVPLSIFIIFGILTRRNLHSVRQFHRSISRQMTKMILLQATTMGLSLFIATVQIIYQSVTMNIQKDALRNAQDNIFNTVANLLTYVTYFGDFYIYLCSSKSLRQALKRIIFNHETTQSITNTMFSTQNQNGIITNRNKVQPIEKNNS
ncbi:unnamed protein product [Rotaria sordida]|uniref:G-protein coupled receptors family 1 profile domain-containing protein n=2 Tax=Rotaria sordida TaxID=392033 RepID=A0A819UHG2_9BILA|nr:unnamed protein product [Rotaria sordida]